MRKEIFVVLSVVMCQCYGVIYKLNISDFSRMPPVFHLDDYDHCIIDPDGIYCTADVEIVSDTQNELYTMMRNYSDYTKKHFNHTLLHHGICVTRTCKNFLQNFTTDIKSVIEACLNESLWRNYELKCRISEPMHCNNKEEYNVIDGGDLAVAAFLLLLLILNLVGSIYDVVYAKGAARAGNGLLLCFSVVRNFSRLLTSYKNFESREERLKGFHGLRTMTIMCVIFCHSLLPFALRPENVYHIEMLYSNIINYIFLNGTIVVQTFFIISGCLLSYNLEIYAEKHELKWTVLSRALVMTWIKLTPSYMVVLALTATWFRYASSGPLWEEVVMKEVIDCRRDGWANVLYVNNYFDHSQCMEQTWFLGANMQLYILGFTVCILLKGKFRKLVLIILFIVGIITPILHTYVQDLDAVLMITPETARTFMDNPTFNNVYKRGHTNIVNFVLGIALGYFIYRFQRNGSDMQKYQKYRYLFLLTFPAIVGSMFIGSFFYMDGISTTIYTKAIYAGLVKPIYGVILAILIIGNVFKIDNVYRVVLEWNGWKIPAKLSYCAFLIHIWLIRVSTGSGRTLVPLTYFRMLEITVAFIAMSYLAAIPFWLLIDAPLTGILQYLVSGKLCQRTEETKVIPEFSNIPLKNNFKRTNDLEEENATL